MKTVNSSVLVNTQITGSEDTTLTMSTSRRSKKRTSPSDCEVRDVSIPDNLLPSSSHAGSQGSTKKRCKARELSEDVIREIVLDSDEEYNVSSSSGDESTESDDSSGEAGSEVIVPHPVSSSPGRIDSPSSFIWSEIKENSIIIPFTGRPGLKVELTGQDPSDFFFLVANDEFVNIIIRETNANAVDILSRSPLPRSRITEWKDVTRDELEVFFGLLFLMGNIRLNRIPYYWKRSNLYDFPIFRQNMSRDRFMLILRALHFSRNPKENDAIPTDPLYKVRPVLDAFVNNMNMIYYPEKNLSLDESMVLWRGRLYFRQYIKSKRHKYGLKLYVLSEPSGLVLNFCVYTGAQDCVIGGRGHTDKVVKYLLQKFLNAGHAVYMDNFYNSVNLCLHLLQNNTYVTGTLQGNRKNNPLDVVNKKLKRGESFSRHTNEGISVMKWRDKREILLISSEHDADFVDVQTKFGTISRRPKMVVKYNQFMGGIDRMDQLLAYYPLERKSLRWYMKLGLHLLNLVMNNAYCLFKKYGGRSRSLLEFRDNVIASLIYKNTIPMIRDAPKPLGENKKNHLPSKSSEKRSQRKRCRVCYSKGMRKDVST
ncbi:piggyBac transposable element-derived protein 4-like [Ischnura elegans]|uniref:piggyBac transposable element-derived protein 4-like n=1 Tax=Ischnura elegans TaxID=197161 RepID=UPI001ED87553|nr:piggyBac transposable element-derived protein 4-like [Ischnura elegans]